MGPSQICGCPFREPRVFEIAHIYIYTVHIYIYIHTYIYMYTMENLPRGPLDFEISSQFGFENGLAQNQWFNMV